MCHGNGVGGGIGPPSLGPRYSRLRSAIRPCLHADRSHVAYDARWLGVVETAPFDLPSKSAAAEAQPFLGPFDNHAIAVTFDDFLDHGAEYLKHGRKNEAAVIAGIVFEDTVRRICRLLDVTEKGIALNTLIDELAKRGVLTALTAKHARFAAGLRTSAAHARWEEIQLSDVKSVIEFTRELMAAHLE